MSSDLAQLGRTIVDLQRRLEKVEAQSRLKSASIDDAAIVVRDGTGALRGIVGQQGDGTTAVTVVNGAPPPAPSTPTAAPALGGISAGWDGLFADGAVIPMDWARVEVHASPDSGFTPDAESLVATIETAQGGIAYIPATVPQYVCLLARNTSGAASPATAQVGPYSPKPVAGEIGIGEITETLIADGAITTPKVFANAITTGLLAAGAVDAVSLKADAITGKIITGGVINGAEIHSDDGAGGLVDIENGTVVTTAATGWKILIDPTQAYPILDFRNDVGITAGSINAMGDSARPGLVMSSGPFTDGGITDWLWATRSGADGAINGWRTGRFRASDLNTLLGGYINLAPDKATLAWIDTDNPSTNTILQIEQGLFIFDEGRLLIEPPVSTSTALYVAAKTGHTGNLLRAQVNLVDRFVVGANGAVIAAGTVTAAGFSTTGSASAGSVTATGAVNAATVTTTGTATIGGTLGTANVTVSGQITKDAAWSTLSTNTGWAGYGGAYGPGRYRRLPDGSVAIRDLVNRTASTTIASGEIVATLPVGYRPVTQVQQNIFVGGSSGGSLSININTNGTITLTNITPGAVTYLSTGAGYISLNGYQYFTD
ncbi:hypothetical protein OG402_41225 [Streptomyces anulatus]|uniref:hypothetical protein n=1 Tax=Streptomyces anulatus TaxID=1892 RepID=UPI002255413D|nr:hypothetical protein [Streptomyces anulatus]MCX4606852.1 hypothetical protein [Streptomyces anulatus]